MGVCYQTPLQGGVAAILLLPLIATTGSHHPCLQLMTVSLSAALTIALCLLLFSALYALACSLCGTLEASIPLHCNPLRCIPLQCILPLCILVYSITHHCTAFPSTPLHGTPFHCNAFLSTALLLPCLLFRQCEWAEAQRSLQAERSHSRDLLAASERAASAAERRQAQAQARESELQAALAGATARADALQVTRTSTQAIRDGCPAISNADAISSATSTSGVFIASNNRAF